MVPALALRMQVDFSIELGRDDPTLEIPWFDPDGRLQYHNLKLAPASLAEIPEAAEFPELRDFLAQLNAPDSVLESAKCDAWSTMELHPEEEIFGEPWKFASYVDLLFSAISARNSFSHHENVLQTLTTLLKDAPDGPSAAEFILRRCYSLRQEELDEGFYFTAYVFGYGANESQARQHWSAALARVSLALLRVSRAEPQKTAL